ncbi:PucR family transcriptional regulator [Nocardia pseudovaccinii]|uniref:PucR family transcriptional regulator n=1 Tax=Nocardia pseudovaccinii TaxID=189540 RepID=UPI003D94B99B
MNNLVRERVVDFLTSHSEAAVEKSLAAADDEIGKHAELSPAARSTCRQNLHILILDAIAKFQCDRKVEDMDLRPVSEVARIYADAGFSDCDILKIAGLIVRSAMAYMLGRSSAEMVGDVIDFVSYSRNAVQVLEYSLISNYRDTLLEKGRISSANEVVGRALVQGYPADFLLAELNLPNFVSCTVVVLSSIRSEKGLHIRRLWRRVGEGLERPDIHWTFIEDGIVLILTDIDNNGMARRLHRRICESMGIQIVSVVVYEASINRIPEALEDGVECIEVIRRMKYPGGCYDSRRLMLERIVLSADPTILVKARRMLQAVVSDASLADTLSAWIAHNGHRARTAGTLNIHPRTLDYRIGKIRTLAELDPTDPSTVPLLRCASIAWSAD